MQSFEHFSDSVEQTEAIAAALAARLVGGECVALHGDLGAGKTQFVRGLVRGLGGNARAVSSPTFVLLNVYDAGRLVVYHLDAYRMGGAEDFDAIGFPELLDQGGVVVVEWPERVSELLPSPRIDVWISAIGEEQRRLVIQRAGEMQVPAADTSQPIPRDANDANDANEEGPAHPRAGPS